MYVCNVCHDLTLLSVNMKETHHGISATRKKLRQKKQYGNMQLEQNVKQNKCNTKKCNIKRAQNEKGAK